MYEVKVLMPAWAEPQFSFSHIARNLYPEASTYVRKMPEPKLFALLYYFSKDFETASLVMYRLLEWVGQ
jgi:hypothetical protein